MGTIKKPSLTDIAEKLGVSTTLVSMVLNGKGKENRISDRMVKKVYEVAGELNYKPNQLARGLRTGRSKTIGMIVADISNPFFANIGRKIEDEASKHGYHVIFCSSDENTEQSNTLIGVLKERQVDGLIIAPTAGSQEQIKALQDLGIPFVLIDRHFPEIETNYIVIDNFEASFKMVTSLLDQGYRRIGTLVFNPEMIHMQQRIQGYREACREKGLDVDESWIRTVDFPNLRESIKQEMQVLMSPAINCDAFFFPTGELAVKSLESLAEQNLQFTEGTGICCFDDPEAFHFSPFPVSTVAQPIGEIGKRAVEIILNEIDQKGSNKQLQKVILPTRFIERQYVPV